MDTETSIAGHRGGIDFGRTHWSMVAAVRDGSEAQARRSLDALCRRYWVPVYAYVRRCGHSPEDSAALVQAFLGQILDRLRGAQLGVGAGFRVFLQEQLENFLAHGTTALAPSTASGLIEPPWPIEQIEKRQRHGPDSEISPRQALQRAFALEVMGIALDRLRDEARESERGELFEAVRPFLSREPGSSDYAALAELMDSSPVAAVVAVKRLRQRFQELVDEELAETVGDADSLENERHTLLSLVSPGTRK